MNRYLIDGITHDLHHGKFIVIVAPTLVLSSHAFRTIAESMSNQEAVQQIRYAHGQESITMHNGGRLTFRALNMKGGRGFTADTVVAMSSEHMSSEQVQTVMQYAAITGAELIQA